MLGALDVHRALLAKDVSHEIVRLTRPVVDADHLPAALGLPADVCVAVRVYALSRAATPYVAAAVPAGSTADPTLLLHATGAGAVRLAGAAEVNAVTDSASGLVPPVALPADVPLLVDARLGVPPVLYTATGEGWTALGISARDLLLHTGARVATLTRDEVPALEGDPFATLDLLGELPAASGARGPRTEGGRPGRPPGGPTVVPAVRSAGVRRPPPR